MVWNIVLAALLAAYAVLYTKLFLQGKRRWVKWVIAALAVTILAAALTQQVKPFLLMLSTILNLIYIKAGNESENKNEPEDELDDEPKDSDT